MDTGQDRWEAVVGRELSVYMEGGGNNNKALRIACQNALKVFLSKAGFSPAARLHIIPCGSGSQACGNFGKHVRSASNGHSAFLLVDSEEPLSLDLASPWAFLCSRTKERLQKPDGSSDEQCHLMVQMTESWFLADRQALSDYFGAGFMIKHLPGTESNVESLPKERIEEGLKKATEPSKRGIYRKGNYSFELLEKIDPAKVMHSSPWAERFVNALFAAANGAVA